MATLSDWNGSAEDSDLTERMLEKCVPEPNTGCWLWMGGLDKNGYGRMIIGRKARRAHRVSYEMLVGKIAAGLTIDHLCRVPACVNPEHLEPVSLRENILRGISPSAQHARQTRCIRGHEFTPDNTDIYCARRGCRTCRLARQRLRRQTKKNERSTGGGDA